MTTEALDLLVVLVVFILLAIVLLLWMSHS